MDVVALGLAKADAARKYGISGTRARDGQISRYDRRRYDENSRLAFCDRTFFAPAPQSNSTGAAGISDGTQTKVTYRIRHKAMVSVHDVELWYTNTKNVVGAETDGDNDITLTSSIEYPTGTFHPAYASGGGRASAVAPGGFGRFRAPVSIKAGDSFYEWVCVTVATAGQVWPLFAFRDAADGKIVGSDATLAGGTIDNTYSRLYQASAIVGVHETPTPVVAVIGDSIAAGFNDVINSGFLTQALVAAGIPYVSLAMGSDQPGKWALNATRRRRQPFLPFATHAIIQEGINGLGTTWANIQTNQQGAWAFLNTYYPGNVWQTTIGPQTSSSNAWIDAAGQTLGANETVRRQLNAYIRSAPASTPGGAGIAGYLETADYMETIRDSGLWRFDGTTSKWTNDGTHPSGYAHTQVATTAPNLSAAYLQSILKV